MNHINSFYFSFNWPSAAHSGRDALLSVSTTSINLPGTNTSSILYFWSLNSLQGANQRFFSEMFKWLWSKCTTTFFFGETFPSQKIWPSTPFLFMHTLSQCRWLPYCPPNACVSLCWNTSEPGWSPLALSSICIFRKGSQMLSCSWNVLSVSDARIHSVHHTLWILLHLLGLAGHHQLMVDSGKCFSLMLCLGV